MTIIRPKLDFGQIPTKMSGWFRWRVVSNKTSDLIDLRRTHMQNKWYLSGSLSNNFCTFKWLMIEIKTSKTSCGDACLSICNFLDQPLICPDSCLQGANHDMYTGWTPLSVSGLKCSRGDGVEGPGSACWENVLLSWVGLTDMCGRVLALTCTA